MRLDKYLADCGLGSRSEVKTFIKKGRVTVNGSLVRSDKFQVDANEDEIAFDGKMLHHQTLFYYMMNKPAGFVSVTQDNQHQTVLELLNTADYRKDIFPAGRLDKDTEGLLFLTNDGLLAHELLSPSKHVEKEYYAKIDGLVTEETVKQFSEGVELFGEKGNPFKGELSVVSTNENEKSSEIRLIIHRGVYHQVKRMFRAVDMNVTYLKRLRMGTLLLDSRLESGSYRDLTKDELEKLRK
ncbi:pseudouridine synthase [Lactococcus termiticola]|uniref:Pseudouridine synthase n=1 Tax=Lactococcus termiticola TaxID=2169526 RepID=A0A2R5HFP4_9LACT|nr:pseudouridine synthase [Lactococcus termiticola]GBG96893.1 ribosomal small subunit pseudouridine synthase A [Lactococcus termiticola]